MQRDYGEFASRNKCPHFSLDQTHLYGYHLVLLVSPPHALFLLSPQFASLAQKEQGIVGEELDDGAFEERR